jgi:hypothetical protein
MPRGTEGRGAALCTRNNLIESRIMNRNVVLAIAAAIVIILVVWLIPWGGTEEPVETAEVEGAEVVEVEDTVDADAALTEDADAVETDAAIADDAELVEGGVDVDEALSDSPAESEADPGETVTTEIEQQTTPEGEEETSTEAAADTAIDVATDEVDSASEARMIDVEDAREVMSAEGFDFERAVAIIEASNIDDTQKATLIAGLDAARDEPEELAEVLERTIESIEAAGGLDGPVEMQ